MRVTVLLTEREHATLSRACGGRGVATMLREAGLREAAAKAPAIVGNPPRDGWAETSPHFVDAGLMTKSPGIDSRAARMHLEIEIACEHFDRTLPGAMDGPCVFTARGRFLVARKKSARESPCETCESQQSTRAALELF